MSQATMSGVVNGVDVERLGVTVQTVQQDPTRASYRFRAANRWIDSGHNRSTI